MNRSKINELWEQAAKTTQGNSWEEQTQIMEKFAELIWEEAYQQGHDAGWEEAILKERG